MKDKKNPVFITYFNPKGLFNHQGVRLDTIGVATVLKENGKISHGLSIKSSLDKMNRKRGSDTAIGKAFSKTPCIEFNSSFFSNLRAFASTSLLSDSDTLSDL